MPRRFPFFTLLFLFTFLWAAVVAPAGVSGACAHARERLPEPVAESGGADDFAEEGLEDCGSACGCARFHEHESGSCTPRADTAPVAPGAAKPVSPALEYTAPGGLPAVSPARVIGWVGRVSPPESRCADRRLAPGCLPLLS